MAFPSQQEIDIIATKILFDAKEAILMLKGWNNSITDGATKLKFFKDLISATAQQMNGDFKAATAAVSKFSNALNINPAAVRQVGKELQTVSENSEKVGHAAESGFGRAVTAVNVLRIALGALVSIILFQIIQAFQQMFAGALKGLTEIESATFNIINAEKRLSEQGIEIDTKGLDELIKKLQVLNPMLSRFQATELISTITTKVAPAIGLGKKEIDSLATSIAVLAVRNQALGKSFEEVEQQVITGLLSGRVTSGINQLGLKITDQIVQEQALRLRLVASTEAYSALNAKEKERIDALSIISILEANTAEEAKNLPEFLKTASGLIGVAKAEFQDLLTSLGQKGAPLLKEIFKGIIQFLERINRSLVEDDDAWKSLVSIITIGAKFVLILAQAFLELSLRIGQAGAKLYEFLSRIPLLGGVVKKLFPEQNFPNTPTAPVSPETDQAAQQSKRTEALKKAEKDIQEIMKDSADKKLDIERDYQRKLADIATDYSNKLQDIARNTAEKREDALRNLNQKIEDINRDANEKIAEANQDARKKEKDREVEFQNKLRELREKFLFDLEDALHERDARQILRLIRQYNLDKKNLEERRKLEEQQSKVDLKRKIADIERDRQLKIEAAKREYADKLNEIAIGEQRALAEARLWQQRQLADARLWHQRQLQEQREYLQRKLKDIADALKAEYNMTAAGAAAITNLMSATLSAQAALLAKIANGTMVPVMSNGALIGGTYPGGGWQALADSWKNSGMYGTGMAEGGTMIATKPTTVTFGERGPEVASFSPIGRNGTDVGKVFGGGSPMGGSISIALQLSPDLEARIVDSSLESVAVHLERVSRSK